MGDADGDGLGLGDADGDGLGLGDADGDGSGDCNGVPEQLFSFIV